MKIAFLTAGGIAPCLSSSIGALIESYNSLAPEAEMIGYLNGYRGLLQGKSLRFPEEVKTNYEKDFCNKDQIGSYDHCNYKIMQNK